MTSSGPLFSMARLCEDFHPSLCSSVLNNLFKKSIHDCLSFVRTNPSLLAEITGLQYNQVLEIKDRILTRFSSHLVFGNKFYEELMKRAAIVRSGIENFDKLLDSGFLTGSIYELCGFAGCGKTQICMTIAANIITSPAEPQVFYIDTKNDISAQRLADIIETRTSSNVGETLQKLKICQVRTSYDLLKLLQNLQLKLRNKEKTFVNLRFIIIDSLSALFPPSNNQENLSLLNNLASLLKYISVEFHIVVLLTNFVRSWTVEEFEGDDDEQLILQQIQQPALGKYWAHVPSVRVMVKKNLNELYLIVLKSSDQPVGKSVKVVIGDNGVT